MRFVIFGAGAVGGVLGARLHQSGFDVTLIARGAHLEAITASGLALETPVERVVLAIPAVGAPEEIDWREDHVVLLVTKSQDTSPALGALRAAAPIGTPVVCMQNGVENERVALRLFPNVYGAVVMTPTAHLEPGIVQAYGAALTGMVYVGRYPSGLDERSEAIAAALSASHFLSGARPDIMRLKHAKLIANLGNAVEAMCGEGAATEELVELARDEGRSVLRAAGIEFEAEEVDDMSGRWERIQVREIAGQERAGSSTWQSLARGTGRIETDYLNGEIALVGRLHGVGAPVNERLGRLADRLAREGGAPGALSAEDLLAEVG